VEKILNYTVDSVIFNNRFSDIVKAHDERGKPVVLKLLRLEEISSERIARFQKEYEITASLKSEYILKCYGIHKYHDSRFFVLEDFGGISFNEYIRKLPPLTNNDQLIKRIELAIHITKGLDDIHKQKVIHKDFNPSNVLINESTEQIKIIDFGLASQLEYEYSEPTDESTFEGTFSYISPEQTGRFNRSVDYRTDFYSLGITLYELFSGTLPFNASSPREWIHCHVAKQPQGLSEVNNSVPKSLSEIVMKLIAKDSEKRYQSSSGLLKDLNFILKALNNNDDLSSFKPGKSDVQPRFRFPQYVYGRQKEIKQLLECYEQVKKGEVRLISVHGQSGIGKTSVVHEIQRSVIESNGIFIDGKFDQHKKNQPFSGIIQAMSSLVRSLLSETEQTLGFWRENLITALNGSGRLIIQVIPELEHIIGPQPVLHELPAVESHNRFFSTFNRFIRVFASETHPLVLFLDDLQWADAASIELIENLLLNQTSRSILLVLAYRSSELINKSRLKALEEKVSESDVNFDVIQLKGLNYDALKEILADSFSFDKKNLDLIARTCLIKTEGNPFFLSEYLSSIAHRKIIYYEFEKNQWSCDQKLLAKTEVADNVAEFIVQRLSNLSDSVLELLKTASCIGSKFSISELVEQLNIPREEIIDILTEASDQSIIYPINDSYRFAKFNPSINSTFKFVHDRVQNETYNLIPETERICIHWNIGNKLIENIVSTVDDDQLFLVLEHLNMGFEKLSPIEKRKRARLNTEACKKAKSAGAFEHVLHYAQTAKMLTDNTIWDTDFNLAKDIYLNLCEAYFLEGEFEKTDQNLEEALPHLKTIQQRAEFIEIRIQSFITQHRQPEAVSEAIRLLKLLGEKFPKKPGIHHTLVQLISLSVKLRKVKNIEDIELGSMKNEASLISIKIISKILSASYYVNPMLFPLLVFRIVNLTLKEGINFKSPVGFIALGLIHYALGKYDKGFLFNRLGMDLFKHLDADEHWSQSATIYYTGLPWKEPMAKAIAGMTSAYKSGVDSGDLEYAGSAIGALCSYRFYSGADLNTLAADISEFNITLNYHNLSVPLNQTIPVQQVIHNLQNLVENASFLNGKYYNEEKWLPHFIEVNDKATANHLFILKMLVSYHYGMFEKTLEFAQVNKPYVKDALGIYPSTVYFFYETLALTARISADPKNKRKLLSKVKTNLKKFKKWTDQCPENFGSKYYLLMAELAKVKGDVMQAFSYYDQAIVAAHQNEFIQEKALANELAGKFWLKNNNPQVGKVYLKNAYQLYKAWGANAIAELLYKNYPGYISKGAKPDSENSFALSSSSLSSIYGADIIDLETVLEASKTISGEIFYSSLVKKSLSIILEHGGAQKGALLIYDNKKELEVVAVGKVFENKINVLLNNEFLGNANLPESIINYTHRTKKILILPDAINEGDYTRNSYVKHNNTRSLLVKPIMHQSKVIGILYLENNLTPGIFSPDKLNILSILCTQLGISIDNAKLYNSLEKKVEERTLELSHKNILLQNKNIEIETAHNQLEELNATKDKFFSIIAHDLRGPIGGMTSFFDIIKDELAKYNIKDVNDLVNSMDKSTKVTYALLNNLLDWARSQRNEIEFNPDNYSLHELIERNINLISQRATEKGVLIDCEFHGDDRAYFDINLVETVLRNLLDNALKFVNVGDRVTVCTNNIEHGLKVSVKDTGIGMLEKERESLFAIDSKSPGKVGTTGEKGTGLGLILCKEFVEKNGGEIWVESEKGKGSVFHFTIPKQL
jgi:predicted ATPase/signal transduction histidine kinase/tRNA A-37 threonylcarbamoyl transferase component Bud32